jgi:hypothetical protein
MGVMGIEARGGTGPGDVNVNMNDTVKMGRK